jgi:glycerol-3-phosphate acyltransferase PlsY
MLVVKALTGKNIREVGSGRTGGTNAMRAGGVLAGVITGIGDVAKGACAVMIARQIYPGEPWLEALCAVAAVVGHNWPIYARFRGGAGTGPNVGAATALWPFSFAILTPLVVGVLILTGYASVASTMAAVSIIVIFIWRALTADQPVAYVAYGLSTAVFVAIALIPNYQRLLRGMERVVGPRSKIIARRNAARESTANDG